MIQSNNRKLVLSGWLMQNGQEEYNSMLKLQTFLFLYEMYSKLCGEAYDLKYLKGSRYGFVFSNVLNDYIYERVIFDNATEKAYINSPEKIDENRTLRIKFLVEVLSKKELSELIHKFNIWSAKKEQILCGKQQIEIQESDFSEHDWNMLKTLEQMYSLEFIKNSYIVKVVSHSFIFNKNDVEKITVQHYDTLSILANSNELINPVFVEIDNEGRLLID